MTMEELIQSVMSDLRALGVPHAVVGGHAVSARTEPRFTRDLDFAINVATDSAAEALVRDLSARGYRITAIIEQEATGRLATVRLEHLRAPSIMVDLLFATSGIEPEVVAGATPLCLTNGIDAPVASIGHLIALKLLAVDEVRRPQDAIDLRALFAIAKAEDLRTAEAAVVTITRRGANRGRDLAAMLRDYANRNRS